MKSIEIAYGKLKSENKRLKLELEKFKNDNIELLKGVADLQSEIIYLQKEINTQKNYIEN